MQLGQNRLPVQIDVQAAMPQRIDACAFVIPHFGRNQIKATLFACRVQAVLQTYPTFRQTVLEYHAALRMLGERLLDRGSPSRIAQNQHTTRQYAGQRCQLVSADQVEVHVRRRRARMYDGASGEGRDGHQQSMRVSSQVRYPYRLPVVHADLAGTPAPQGLQADVYPAFAAIQV
ncbi:hypothetical protein ASG87_18840 [Frateuria sp. Soil773]|nr:hypothetical protein ASG87_18840 [Frateuria sp. Soil773]